MTSMLWSAAWAERPRLLRIARRRSLNRSDAEDAVQEAIVRCVTHPGMDPERLAGMLTAVTMRLCVDQLRERVNAERAANLLPALRRDELDEVLDRAEAQWLAAETARLAGRERAAVMARVLGLSTAEAADALGVSYKAAESALARARRKLRAVWGSTLGVLVWLRRAARSPVSAPVVVAAVFGVGSLLSGVPDAGPSAKNVDPARSTRAAVVRAAHLASADNRTLVRPVVSRPLTVPIQVEASTTGVIAPTAVAPAVTAGPIRQAPTPVWVDAAEPPEQRLRRCVDRGIAVTVSPSYVGVVCPEEP